MASRQWTPGPQALEQGTINLHTDFTVGASGAVTLVKGVGKGIASIVRNSAGNYTITLQDQYTAFLAANVTVIDATAITPKAQVASTAVTATVPTVVVQFYNATGTATDPNTTAVVKVTLVLKNSTV